MKKEFKSIRKWLINNKIFFEIAASLSVIFIAIQANIISKAQVENSELINQPIFTINKLDNGNILIDSDSFRYTNLELTIGSELYFTYTIKGSIPNSQILRFPEEIIIEDNFRYITNPNTSSEIELDLVGEKDSLFLASKNSMKSYFEKKYKKGIDIDNYLIHTFLELSYYDFKGKEQVIFFDITKHPRRVPERLAKPVINQEINSIYLDLMDYEFLDDLFDPQTYYNKDGKIIRFTDGLEFYYDEEGRKIKLTDSTS